MADIDPVLQQAKAAWSMTLDRRTFETAVTIARHLTASKRRRGSVPALGAMRLGIDGDGMARLYATNLDGGIDIRLGEPQPHKPPRKSARPVLVGVDDLRAALKAARAAGSVDIRLTARDGTLTLTAGATEIEMKTPMDPDGLPQMDGPNFDSPTFRQITLASTADFAQALTFVATAISTQETRYYLNGICLDRDTDTGQCLLVATDGHRLHAAPVQGIEEPAPADPDCRPIVPHFTVDTIRRLIAKAADPQAPFRMELDMTSLRFETDLPGMHVTVVSKLIDGVYPDWRRVVPKGPKRKRLVCETAAMSSAARIMASGDASRKIVEAAVLERQGGRTTVTLRRKRACGDTVMRTTATVERGGIRDVAIGWQPRYLRDALAAFPSGAETIGITFDGEHPASSPAILAAEQTGPFVVLMPMRI